MNGNQNNMDFILLLILALNFLGLGYLINRINEMEDRVISIQAHANNAESRRKLKNKSIYK